MRKTFRGNFEFSPFWRVCWTIFGGKIRERCVKTIRLHVVSLGPDFYKLDLRKDLRKQGVYFSSCSLCQAARQDGLNQNLVWCKHNYRLLSRLQIIWILYFFKKHQIQKHHKDIHQSFAYNINGLKQQLQSLDKYDKILYMSINNKSRCIFFIFILK